MAKSISKEKKKKFIAKISADGKITKEEGKKAANKGITLQKISNRNIGDYRQEKSDFSKNLMVRNRNPGAKAPTYEPLKIKRGAIQAQTPTSKSTPKKDRSAGIARRERLAKQEKKKNKKAKAVTETTTTESPTPQDFTSDTPDFEAMMAQQAADYQNRLSEMQAANEAAQQEYMRQAEEQRKQFELAQRTMLGNQSRAGQQASYQLGGEPGFRGGGTSGFRRRRARVPSSIMSGITTASRAALNI